ncbi:MAG: hypothetical protein WC365_08305 [Candidatus Babeliales bacterium]|jgi:hypothetical protein
MTNKIYHVEFYIYAKNKAHVQKILNDLATDNPDKVHGWSNESIEEY